jgi:DNA-binding transcriptional ArsR family regulator
MSARATKPQAIQVDSDPIKGELIEIKDRLDGIEALQAHVHRDQIEALVRKAVGDSFHRKNLLRLCETPMTIADLQKSLNLNSPQAVNKHLAPLKHNGLLYHHSTVVPVSYVWSPLLSRLNKAVRDELLK